jgi:UDP-N-acetylmuramyl pentapeptide phosphotransferase/UDP-N-acetylglucosamine-1-phosphate transferase
VSKTSGALLLKFIITFAAAYLTVGLIDRNPIGWIFVLAILGTFLNYLIGDLFILRRTNNIFASLMDGALSALTAYLLDLSSRNFNTTIRSLVYFGLVVIVAEYFFHRYLKSSKKVAP